MSDYRITRADNGWILTEAIELDDNSMRDQSMVFEDKDVGGMADDDAAGLWYLCLEIAHRHGLADDIKPAVREWLSYADE